MIPQKTKKSLFWKTPHRQKTKNSIMDWPSPHKEKHQNYIMDWPSPKLHYGLAIPKNIEITLWTLVELTDPLNGKSDSYFRCFLSPQNVVLGPRGGEAISMEVHDDNPHPEENPLIPLSGKTPHREKQKMHYGLAIASRGKTSKLHYGLAIPSPGNHVHNIICPGPWAGARGSGPGALCPGSGPGALTENE